MFKRFLLLVLLVLSIPALHAQTVGYVLGFDGITVLNIPANTVAATIPVDPNQFSLASVIVASPDGARVYALYEVPGTVLVIDAATNTPVTSVLVGVAPLGLAISPDGAHLYVADQINGVFIVDTATNTVEATSIPVTGFPDSLAITPDGAHLYVGAQVGSVSIIDTASNTIVGSPIPIGCTPDAMVITPDGTKVYVGCDTPGQVVAINTASNTVSATIPFDGIDFRLAVTPDGSHVYVSGLTSGSVGVLATATNTLTTIIPVGSSPTGIAVTPDGADVYVAVSDNSTASMIDTATNAVTAAGIPVASGPQDLTIANLSTRFAAFTIDNLVINNNLHEQGDFTLGANTGGIDLAHQALILTVNSFSLTIPAGSFRQVGGNMHFVFNGAVNGLGVNFNIKAVHGSSTQFTYVVDVHGTNVTGPDPATVGLKIGHNTGTTTAEF